MSKHALMDEFADAVRAWRSAGEQFVMVDKMFVDAVIHRLNAAEARINGILQAARAADGRERPSLRQVFAKGDGISRVAVLTDDDHIRYRSSFTSTADA